MDRMFMVMYRLDIVLMVIMMTELVMSLVINMIIVFVVCCKINWLDNLCLILLSLLGLGLSLLS